MAQFIKLEVIEGKDNGDSNHLVDIDIGANTKEALTLIATEKQKMILLGMKNVFN